MQQGPAVLLQNPAHRVTFAPPGSNCEDAAFRSETGESDMLEPLDDSFADGIAVSFARVLHQVIENKQARTFSGQRSASAGRVVFAARRGCKPVDGSGVGREFASGENFAEGRVAQNVA